MTGGALKINAPSVLQSGTEDPLVLALLLLFTVKKKKNSYTVCPHRFCPLYGELGQIRLFSCKTLYTREWRSKLSASVLHNQVSNIHLNHRDWVMTRRHRAGWGYSSVATCTLLLLVQYAAEFYETIKPMDSLTPVQRTNTCVQTQSKKWKRSTRRETLNVALQPKTALDKKVYLRVHVQTDLVEWQLDNLISVYVGCTEQTRP